MPRLAPVINTVLFAIFARNDRGRRRQSPGAVDVIHDEAPRLRPAMVIGEIGRLGEGAGETIRYLESSVDADQFTNSVPVLTIESIHIELKNTR
jgi:hypothetical protein